MQICSERAKVDVDTCLLQAHILHNYTDTCSWRSAAGTDGEENVGDVSKHAQVWGPVSLLSPHCAPKAAAPLIIIIFCTVVDSN